MNTEFLKHLKKSYKAVEAPHHLQVVGWDELYQKMQKQKRGFSVKIWISRVSFVALVVLSVLGGVFGLFKVASASMPGSQLYPIKRFGEKVIEKTTGNYQITIDHRAEEIVNLAKEKEEDSIDLEKTVKEYSQTVRKSKEELGKSEEKKKELGKRLEEHRSNFEKAVKENPSAKNDIKKAIEATQDDD